MAWPGTHRHTLTTRLSPAECRQRLEERRLPFLSLGWFTPARRRGGRVIQGRVSERGFSIRKVIYYRNSMQTEARGKFMPFGSETRIDPTLGPSPLVLVFLTLFAVVFAVLLGTTTVPLLLETANALARPAWRASAVALIEHLRQREDVQIVPLESGRWE